MTIDLPADVDTHTLFGFTYDGDGTNFHIFPVQVAGHTLTFQVSHFTGFGAATGNPADFAVMLQPILNSIPGTLSVTQVQELVDLIGSWESQFPGITESTLVALQAENLALFSLNFRSDEAFREGLRLALEPVLARDQAHELVRIEGLRQFLGATDHPGIDHAAVIVKQAIKQAGAEALVNPRLGTLQLLDHLSSDAAVLDRNDLQQLAYEKLDAGLAKLLADAVAVCDTDHAFSLQLLHSGVDNFRNFLNAFDSSLLDDFDRAIVNCSVTITVAPTSANVGLGGQVQFTATVTGPTNTAVTWSVNSSTAGTIDPHTGLFTAGQNPDTREIKATSVAVPSKFATASLNIGNVTIAPAFASVRVGAQLQFTATVSRPANTAVT